MVAPLLQQHHRLLDRVRLVEDKAHGRLARARGEAPGCTAASHVPLLEDECLDVIQLPLGPLALATFAADAAGSNEHVEADAAKDAFHRGVWVGVGARVDRHILEVKRVEKCLLQACLHPVLDKLGQIHPQYKDKVAIKSLMHGGVLVERASADNPRNLHSRSQSLRQCFLHAANKLVDAAVLLRSLRLEKDVSQRSHLLIANRHRCALLC
mmetsp:Transcript_113310/g.301085  ORF Transcript_113310/g.301085 Transcript_113310/m.301085 type:complete len:211 (+) Transcript_113310:442-1074(+)